MQERTKAKNTHPESGLRTMSTLSELWSSEGRDKQAHPECPSSHLCTQCP